MPETFKDVDLQYLCEAEPSLDPQLKNTSPLPFHVSLFTHK